MKSVTRERIINGVSRFSEYGDRLECKGSSNRNKQNWDYGKYVNKISLHTWDDNITSILRPWTTYYGSRLRLFEHIYNTSWSMDLTLEYDNIITEIIAKLLGVMWLDVK